MQDDDSLQAASADELLEELRVRARDRNRPLDQNEHAFRNKLRVFDDGTLVKALRERQKAIYGVDDRVDIFQLTNGADLDDADCVAALFTAADISSNGNGTSTITTQNFGQRRTTIWNFV